MNYLIETINSIKGIYKGVIVEKYDFTERKIKLFKIQLSLINDYTYAYGSSNKLGDVEVGNNLLINLSLINFNNNFSKEKYPVLIVKSIISSETIAKNDINKNIEEISNNKIKKMNDCIKCNESYLFNIVGDYDDYYKDDCIKDKVSNYLEMIKKASFGKVKIKNNDEEGSIDIIYRKEGSRKDIEIFSIVSGDTFTAFEYLEKILFFETNDKYQIYGLVYKIFKHFNIRLDKSIDLEMKFIEIFGTNENKIELKHAKDEYKKVSNTIIEERNRIMSLLKDKKILIIGRGVLEHRKDLIYDLCTDFGFDKKNVFIENDNNKIISKGNDYIQKIKNNFYCGVIVGQTPHSSTGKYNTNSLLDTIKKVANPKYCYVYASYSSLENETQRIMLKLSKARLKKGLEEIVDNLTKYQN